MKLEKTIGIQKSGGKVRKSYFCYYSFIEKGKGITINYSAIHSAWANILWYKVAKVALLKDAERVLYILYYSKQKVFYYCQAATRLLSLQLDVWETLTEESHGTSQLVEILFEEVILSLIFIDHQFSEIFWKFAKLLRWEDANLMKMEHYRMMFKSVFIPLCSLKIKRVHTYFKAREMSVIERVM